MDTSTLKKFAQQARRTLLEQVETKLKVVLIEGSQARRESADAVSTLESLIAEASKTQVIEQVAYTWFNRFCALRFMDANRYSKVGVVSPGEGFSQPEILMEAKQGVIDDDYGSVRNKVFGLLDGSKPSADPQQEAYRLLLVAACNSYHSVMPFMFEKIEDFTELLIPDDLLSDSSILAATREGMPVEACKDVEVIGWLYQFYISEKKDAVMARKAAVPTDDIPAVTQLFTPHWIVRYLVENSLGRLWMLNYPDSRLRERMSYYIEGESETDFLTISKPEEIRLLDPACGSGHMLTYAYDLLYAIYDEQGYAPTEIPGLILKHNLFGTEICDRAAALAAFALCMKARSSDSRYFRRVVQPNVISLQDVHIAEDELDDYIHALGLGDLFNQPMLRLLHQFEEAKNFGSLILPCLDERAIADVRRAIEEKDLGGQLFLRETHLKVLRVLEQAEALTQRYHVVVANPPYMGNKGQNGRLKKFLEEHLDGYDTDLFAAFIVRSLSLCLSEGYLGFMSPFVWMFISSYEELRKRLISEATITTLVQLEYSGFDGATVPICTFALQNKRLKNYRGGYIRLSDFRGSENQSPKTLEAIANPSCGWFFRAAAADFTKIPGSPIAYWVSPRIRAIFATAPTTFEDVATPRQGLGTGENSRFTRFWSEVPFGKIGFGCSDSRQAMASLKKWFPYTKGGGFRKWTGNKFDVVNWEHDGKEIREALIGKNPNIPRSEKHYFREGITWGLITSAEFSARYVEPGAIFDVGGSKAFPDSRQRASMLGLLNSKLTALFLKSLNPTLNFQVGDLKRIPIVNFDGIRPEVDKVIGQTIQLSEADWDNFETSWDFRDQPLLRPGLKGATLEASWRNWEAQCSAAIRRMQELETENNRLFIAAYGLDGELQPEVPEAQITLARAEARRDMAAFLSYAVGCMMGRYSPEHPGLILANAGDSLREFLEKVGKPLAELSFAPDEDGIIPVLDGEWFEDDITERFKQFLKATFGTEHFEANVRFVEESVGKGLRKYFLTDFYKDHLQTYKKRPIYWLFSSPKGAFNALVYMHRYRPDTVSVVLGYLRDFNAKLKARVETLQRTADSANASASEKTKALKEIVTLKKDIRELDDYERDILYPLATERREIDLDDGVKLNYPKFGKALKKIAGMDSED